MGIFLPIYFCNAAMTSLTLIRNRIMYALLLSVLKIAITNGFLGLGTLINVTLEISLYLTVRLK
ncbi:Protein of unknown function [Lactobacillus helveticus CIRM-BIA 101]|nr:Protein of unknown function [Lactobacillus helveticus CIRM-BIA 101]